MLHLGGGGGGGEGEKKEAVANICTHDLWHQGYILDVTFFVIICIHCANWGSLLRMGDVFWVLSQTGRN